MPPITDPVRLAVLEKARAKAKSNRDERNAAKAELEKQKAEKESLVKPEEVPPPPVLKRQDAEIPKEIKQEDPEPQVVIVKQPKKPKKKVIYVDESSSEDEPIVIKRRGRRKQKIVYEDELDTPLHGGEKKFVNPRNVSKPPQNDLTANLAKPSDKQELPPPPPVRPDKPYSFQVSSIMGKYFPN